MHKQSNCMLTGHLTSGSPPAEEPYICILHVYTHALMIIKTTWYHLEHSFKNDTASVGFLGFFFKKCQGFRYTTYTYMHIKIYIKNTCFSDSAGQLKYGNLLISMG